MNSLLEFDLDSVVLRLGQVVKDHPAAHHPPPPVEHPSGT